MKSYYFLQQRLHYLLRGLWGKLPESNPVISLSPSPLRYSSRSKPSNLLGSRPRKHGEEQPTSEPCVPRTEQGTVGTQALPARHLHWRRGDNVWSLGALIELEGSACWSLRYPSQLGDLSSQARDGPRVSASLTARQRSRRRFQAQLQGTGLLL